MGRKDHKIAGLVVALLVLFSACKKDSPGNNCCGTLPVKDSENVYIVCEGQYQVGDASLYLYNLKTDSVYGDIYKAVNGQALGDIFQSMQLIGNNFFLCINNSNKIVVINRNTWVLQGTINIPQPRYVVAVSDTQAYVSSLYSKNVYVINPQTLAVKGTVVMPSQNPEGMLAVNNNVYVCTWDTTTKNIYTIDATTNHIVQTIPVAGYAPDEVLQDNEHKLWILSGNQADGRVAAFTQVDPTTGQVLKSMTFPAAANPIKAIIHNDTLYFIEADYNGGTQYNGIYRMPVTSASLPTQAFIQAQQNQYYYALDIDPLGNIYVGDPKGFNQKGSVSIYHTDGTMFKQFSVGTGPGHFVFEFNN
jgi:DNA-binding beta-propeller fold protein YncE